MKRKNDCQKKFCQIDQSKLSMLWNTIHLTLAILLSSDLEIILTHMEMKRRMTKTKSSGLDHLILDK